MQPPSFRILLSFAVKCNGKSTGLTLKARPYLRNGNGKLVGRLLPVLGSLIGQNPDQEQVGISELLVLATSPAIPS
jgi:hypothetical protein